MYGSSFEAMPLSSDWQSISANISNKTNNKNDENTKNNTNGNITAFLLTARNTLLSLHASVRWKMKNKGLMLPFYRWEDSYYLHFTDEKWRLRRALNLTKIPKQTDGKGRIVIHAVGLKSPHSSLLQNVQLTINK